MSLRFSPLVVLGLAAMAGCFSNAADAGGNAGPSGGNAPTGPTGLPCDVQQLLADQCWSCHGVTPAKDVPFSLTSYESLTAEASKGKTVAQAALERMKNASNPMPPGKLLGAGVVAPFEAWVTAGAQKGSCGDTAAEAVFEPPPTGACQMVSTRTKGLDMAPGGKCIDCHAKERAKGEADARAFTFAGTVFTYGRAPDYCKVVDETKSQLQGLSVEITGADGKSFSMGVRSGTGNFSTMASVKMPYTARVIQKDATGAIVKERAMATSQTSGDCNACHTANGTTTVKDGTPAPGRILVP